MSACRHFWKAADERDYTRLSGLSGRVVYLCDKCQNRSVRVAQRGGKIVHKLLPVRS